MKRRDAIRAMAAGVAGGAAMSSAETTPPPETPDSTLTVSDLAAADKVAGRGYAEAERELMLARVTEIRDRLQQLRQGEFGATEPAFHFEPRLPGMHLPRGRSQVRVSRGRAPRVPADPEKLAFMTVVELSRLIQAR